MASESTLNFYYNKGGFNKPERIGYMMNMIRTLKPLTEDEWKIWYYNNVHNEDYISDIAQDMYDSIPSSFTVSLDECHEYVIDVMFRRTFQGYNRENLALRYLQEYVSHLVKEAPKEWDTEYFIDFYIDKTNSHPLIGIQLKPDTFYFGGYQSKVNICEKMNRFCEYYNALAYVLQYDSATSSQGNIEFRNPEVIDEIKNNL